MGLRNTLFWTVESNSSDEGAAESFENGSSTLNGWYGKAEVSCRSVMAGSSSMFRFIAPGEFSVSSTPRKYSDSRIMWSSTVFANGTDLTAVLYSKM